LSDIHFKTFTDPIILRRDSIADAVKNLDYSLDLCVVAISGDIAHSGSESQYIAAWSFLEELGKRLTASLSSGRENLPVPVKFVAVPGNHDCDFQGEAFARQIVAEHIAKEPDRSLDASVVEICTQPQSQFFQFLEACAPDQTVATNSQYSSKLYYEYRFSVRDESIRFMCCNTAWLSQLHESPGKLIYPAEAIPNDQLPDTMRVVMFHHPYNWGEPVNSRQFRKRVESIADLILTGHEHDATRRVQEGDGGERNTHVEGGALQDSEDWAASSFNVFVLDTGPKKQKFARFEWEAGHYSLVGGTSGDEGAGLAWEDFQVNRLRERGRFEINPTMQDYLSDLELTVTHRNREKVLLDDLFVFPDLREVLYRRESVARLIRGENIIDFITKTPYLLITGDNQAGKTSLAKMIFKRLHEGGLIPVLIKGAKQLPSGDRLYGHIEKLFIEQYELDSLNAFQQLDRHRRVIVLDDYHKLQLDPSSKRKILGILTKFAMHVVLISHEIILVEDLVRPKGRIEDGVSFQHFRIQQLGYLRRSRLVEKWLLLGTETGLDESDFIQKVSDCSRAIDTVIGRNFVPAYPLYIVSILQGLEAAMPIDTSASTHGYFYELFIKAALAKHKSRFEFDIATSYLAHLAHQMFVRRLADITNHDLEQVHKAYEQRYAISRPFEHLRDELIERGILEPSDDSYRFKHKYLYYYFVASYLRDHIGAEDVRDQIKASSKNIFIEENANILLFLAHLSKDPIVINTLLETADSLYPDCLPISFDDDVKFLDELEQVPDGIVYHDRNPIEVRREMLEAMDRDRETAIQQDTIASDEAVAKALEPLAKLNMALKTIQILGQILKNFPGSLESSLKLTVTKACFSLGLRACTSLYGLIRENERSILLDIIGLVRERHPSMNEEDAERRARETLVGMARGVAFGLIKKVSLAVGAPDLAATFDQVVNEFRTDSVRLIHASLDLDHAGAFPVNQIKKLASDYRSKPLPLWVLKTLVVNHFYLFPVNYQTKQLVCGTLEIPYAEYQATDPERKLI
jgi:hypothetical protein